MRQVLSKIIDMLGRLVRRAREAHTSTGTVCYYPPFPSREALTNHYYRACWYLPRVAGLCEQVALFQTYANGESRPGTRPMHMCEVPGASAHISIRHGRLANFRALLRSRLILVWKAGRWSRCIAIARRLGFMIVNVDTDDPGGQEYVNYSFLLWYDLLAEGKKRSILDDNRMRFATLAAEIVKKDYRRACVLGTGPSLNDVFELDFSDVLTIVCNSTVKNTRLMSHTHPAFLAAADVVSHFGVSSYAQQFRTDVLELLEERAVTFVTVAGCGYLFLCHYPHVADRVILIEQTGEAPCYNLLEDFRAPMMDSVLNSLMLPLAASFSKEIDILGCDGKRTDGDNEDFWPHAASAQYHDLVQTGHLCHPTFDAHRSARAYHWYTECVETTIALGERDHAITYRCLAPSNIPALKQRLSTDDTDGHR